MSLLDAYRQKLDAQIQEQKARLDLLKARARKAAANGKILGYEELANADRHLGQVKAKFKELSDAGGHALAEIRTGMGKALEDLKTSTHKAAVHLKAQPPTPPAQPAPPKPTPSPRTKPARSPQKTKRAQARRSVAPSRRTTTPRSRVKGH
jgi:hypothetical protein